MSVFDTPGRLASWAGVCPGIQRVRRPGQIHTDPARQQIPQSARWASPRCPLPRRKDTYLAAKYRRIAARRGPIKAIVAIEHAILTATWHMLANGEVYTDPARTST